jgi:hypothetical protein
MIDEVIEVGIIAKGKIALEDDSIEAAQNGDNAGSELDDKGILVQHGVLLQKGASTSPFCLQNASSAFSFLVAALPL